MLLSDNTCDIVVDYVCLNCTIANKYSG